MWAVPDLIFRGYGRGRGATLKDRDPNPDIGGWRIGDNDVSKPREVSRIEMHWTQWAQAIWPGQPVVTWAPYHRELWDWAWAIPAVGTPAPYVAAWSRGWAKSHHAERVSVMLGARGVRRYCLYVSNTQEQADDHVSSIASHMESASIERYYPGMGERAVNKYGSSRGWRRNRLRTASGFTVDALGMDRAIRGVKLDDDRPDLIVLDDVDSEDDGQSVLDRKRNALTRRILPAGDPASCAVLVAQNLVHPNGIVSQLVDGRADYLVGRIVSGPHPAVLGLTYEGSTLTGGEPTWELRDLAACQGIVDRIGLRAFLAECQHDIEQVGQPRFDREAIRVAALGCRPGLPQAALPDDLQGVEGLTVWALPRPGVPYVVYTDPAEGKGRDYTATVAVEARTLVHVATLRDNTREASQHAAIAVGLARLYNGAFAGWESNKGEQVSYVYGAEGYSRLYWHQAEATLQMRMAGRDGARHLGFPVTAATRPGLIEDLAVAVETYALTSWDENLWKEAASFILTANGRAQAAAGSHDDLVMAMAGAVRIARQPGAQAMVDEERVRRPAHRWSQ